jgi:GTP-binding protein
VVVINKIDRHDARPKRRHDEVLDLFIELGCDDERFGVSRRSTHRPFRASPPVDPDVVTEDIYALFDMIIDHVPPPEVDPTAPLQMLVTTLDYNDYVGSDRHRARRSRGTFPPART